MQTRVIDRGYGETQVAICFECANSIDKKEQDASYTRDFWGESLKITTCAVCGESIDSILKTGFVGCATCYRIFKRELNGFIQSIHGNNRHVGKLPLTIINKKDEEADVANVMDRALDMGSFDLANIARNHFPGRRR